MKKNFSKNILVIDCDQIIKDIEHKYGSTPILSSKYERVKNSITSRKSAIVN